MEKRVGRSYAALIRSGVEWIERQNPRDVYLTSADGLRLHARWIPHAHAQGTMILFHGWRSSIVGDFSPSLPEYYARGYNLLLVDQRANNGSQGKYITLGIRESRDVPDWVALHNQTFGPYPVILGGVVAVLELMRQTGFERLTVSESDLLFGLALTAAASLDGTASPVGWRPEMHALPERPLR